MTFASDKKFKRPSSRRARRGMSLIEVVVLASVTSTMLVLATGWIHQTMKQSSRFRMERRQQLAVFKLSQHFRNHVWQSESAGTSEANSVSLLNPAGEHFKYSFADQQINFSHRNSEGELKSLERFVFPALSKATFGQTDNSMVMIKLETSAGAQTKGAKSNGLASRTSLVIKSTLARWLPTSNSTSSTADAGSSEEENEVLE